MSQATPLVRRLTSPTEADLHALAAVLADCVEGGASVSFMLPTTQDKAMGFWRKVAVSAARGERALLVAEDASGIVGTVQVVWDLPENRLLRARPHPRPAPAWEGAPQQAPMPTAHNAIQRGR